MNTKIYQQAGKALDDEAQRLWSLIKSLRDTGLDTPETEAFGDLSSYDQHPADHGSETFEREKDLGLLLDTYQQLEQVAHARERLATGDYTACESCGWPIDHERLAALPSASLCLSCKMQNELSQDNFHRPVEEEVLSPPFGRRFYRGGPGFDAEDAWQAVARFGSANSPQDVPDSIEFDDAYVDADVETLCWQVVVSIYCKIRYNNAGIGGALPWVISLPSQTKRAASAKRRLP
jgi:YteA family regulatory protein